MNHDYAHCAGFSPDCPKKCFRAELVRDLKLNITDVHLPVIWLDFLGTAECMKKDGKIAQWILERLQDEGIIHVDASEKNICKICAEEI